MSGSYRFNAVGLNDGISTAGLGMPGDAHLPSTATKQFVHTGSGTDYLTYNDGGDILVYG